MDVKVEINAEQVQQQIVKAIVDGAIGNHIEKAVNDVLSSKNSWTDNMVQSVVKYAVATIARQEIMKILEGRREQIKDKLAERLTDELMDKTLEKLVKHSLDY